MRLLGQFSKFLQFFSTWGLIMLSSHLLWVWLKCVRKGYNWLSYAKFCAFYFGSIMQYCPTFSMQLRLISLETQYSYLKIFRFSCAFYIALYHCSSTSIRLLPSSASVNFNFNFKLEAEIATTSDLAQLSPSMFFDEST